MKKRILFSVSTEYQLLIALIIIDKKYRNDDLYEVLMIQLSPRGNERMGDLHINTDIFGFAYREFEYDYYGKFKDGAIPKIKEFIGNSPVEEFLFFNEQEFINIYIADILKRKGAKITLAPDGAKAYVEMTHSAWKFRIKLSFLFHKYFIKSRIPYLTFSTFDLRYGALSTIDTLLLQYPKGFKNIFNRKIETFDYNFSDKGKQWLAEIFNTEQVLKDIPLDNIVFFINQGTLYKTEEFNAWELEVLEKILKNTQGLVVYKPHPFTKKEHLEKVKGMDRVIFVESKIPAELIILNLCNSKVVSFWSTSCLVPNPSCSFYWLKKIAKEKGVFPNKIILNNPAPHLQEIKTLDPLFH